MFGSEYAGYETESAPEIVYIPCERIEAKDREARVELRQDGDERLVMLAYSSLEELVRCCGNAQPWIGVRTDRVSQVQLETGAEAILWDLHLPDGARHSEDAMGQE